MNFAQLLEHNAFTSYLSNHSSKTLHLIVIISVVYFVHCVFCYVSRLFMEELVNYIHRFPLSEKSTLWKDERIQKWVVIIFLVYIFPITAGNKTC